MPELLKLIQTAQYDIPLITQLIGLYLLVIWLGVVIWVARDITTRSSSVITTIASVLFVGLTNVPGLIIYFLVRPARTLDEVNDSNLFQASILDKDISSCGNCGELVRSEYKFCPNCSQNLEYRCPSCGDKINPAWNYCTHCDYKLFPDPMFDRLSKSLKNLFTTGYKNKQTPKLLPAPSKIDLPAQKKRVKPFLNRAGRRIQEFIPEMNLNLPQRSEKLSVIAEKREVETLDKPAIRVGEVPESKAKSTRNGKSKRTSRRGRPKGSTDNRRRKKRSDKGKKRGKYKK